MSISITRISDDLYVASATPPDVSADWRTTTPMRGRQLTRTLIEMGAHQQDVGDAMYEADPVWVQKLRDPSILPSQTS
jgi:hypothetical protein